MTELKLELPWPPSTNRVWRRYGGRTLLAAAARKYRRAAAPLVKAAMLAAGLQTLTGPLAATIDLHPPTRQRYDADNRIKALLDALQAAGLVEDDAQFMRLTITKRPVAPQGQALVTICLWEE